MSTSGTVEVFELRYTKAELAMVPEGDLAPPPDWLGRCLADALAQAGSIREPFWVSWHSSQEKAGEARGEVFDFD